MQQPDTAFLRVTAGTGDVHTACMLKDQGMLSLRNFSLLVVPLSFVLIVRFPLKHGTSLCFHQPKMLLLEIPPHASEYQLLFSFKSQNSLGLIMFQSKKLYKV